jgi:hypothetical protein
MGGRKGKDTRILRCEGMKVLYSYTHGGSITKPTKDSERGRGGRGQWRNNGGSELVQDALCTCMELLQRKPFILLMHDKQIIKCFKTLKITLTTAVLHMQNLKIPPFS